MEGFHEQYGPSWTAQLDQANKGLTDLSQMAGDFYQALIDAGVPSTVADPCVVELVRSGLRREST